MNKEKRNYCVYMHVSPSNKKYIGITCKTPKYRWGKDGRGYLDVKDGKYTQPAMARAILKYPWDQWKHYILLTGETYEYACKVERCLIKAYHTNNKKYGYNLTSGGEGTPGRKHTEEEKRHLSEMRKGKLNPMYGVRLTGEKNGMYGKHHSEEFKQYLRENFSGENAPMYGKHLSDEAKSKISKKAKERCKDKKNCSFYGKRHTLEAKQQMSKTKKERYSGPNHPGCRPVFCPELNESFWGAKEADLKYGIANQEIAKCCKGKIKSVGKHPETGEKLHWIYLNETEERKAELERYWKEDKSKKPVYCIELDEEFWGAKEAQDKYGISKSSITGCCKGRLKSAGKHPITGEKLHWEYVDKII